jgi:endo-1,4-beta-xylanase
MANFKSPPSKVHQTHCASFQITLSVIVCIFLTGVAINPVAQPAAKGANKFLGNITTRNSVRPDFLKYWNQITGENEHKWLTVEGTRDRMNWRGGNNIANFAEENDILWKFHTLIWGSQYPIWMNSISQSEQLAEIEEWFDEVKKTYPDIPMIDVVNEAFESNGGRHEPPPWKNALGGNGSTGFDYIIKAFQMARQRWPKAILIYNDYNNIEYNNEVNWTVQLVTAMKKANAPIDAIGCQAHDAYKIPTAMVKSNIDKLASTGLPIFITEYDIGQADDNTQKKIMQEQFTMFWNHPKIVGITYWGYIVGSTWRANTGILNSNGTERPALTWLIDFVKDNPNPPNDFSSFLKKGGGSVSIDYSLTPVKLERKSTKEHLIEVFDLQGRMSGTRFVNNQTITLTPLPSAQGCYIVKKNGQRNEMINRLR